MPPGSVVFTGNQKVAKVQLHYLKYNATHFEEHTLDSHSEIVYHQPTAADVNWLDIRGIHDTDLIQQLGKIFELHPLILEAIVDTNQRPKFEEYEKGIFLIFKALSFDKQQKKIIPEQIALYFRNDLLITFQEDHTDIFTAIRQRLHTKKGKIRLRGADYLAYSLVDNLVDNYFQVLDQIEEEIEQLEDKLLESPDVNAKEAIHLLKKEVIRVRKAVSPLREAINLFSKSDSAFIAESTGIFIRNLYGNTIQIMDIADTYRDILNGLQDLYISEISFKMNQVMQVLTIITTIFVPLSFLVGLYGMNFDHMPELHYKYGYFVLLGIMFLIAIGLLIWFRRKKWL